MKDDRLYLIHISESVARMEEYVRGGRHAFLSSTLIQDAVVRNLQTLAESSRRLSDDLKSRHPDIDWRGIAGLRNVLVHDYLGTDSNGSGTSWNATFRRSDAGWAPSWRRSAPLPDPAGERPQTHRQRASGARKRPSRETVGHARASSIFSRTFAAVTGGNRRSRL